MDTYEELLALFSQPTPAGLYRLGTLLREKMGDAPEGARVDLAAALAVAADYHTFLSNVQAKMTAEGYNRLASLMDLGAVGTVTIQNLLAEREHMLRRLIVGGVGESLMLIGSLQYIKAWEQETRALHEQAAWQLSDALWRLSLAGQPELSGAQRRQVIDALLSPCFDAELPPAHKTVYVGWMFQLVLLAFLSRAGMPTSTAS